MLCTGGWFRDFAGYDGARVLSGCLNCVPLDGLIDEVVWRIRDLDR